MQEEKIVKKIDSVILDNGFKVILTPHHAHKVISLQLFVRIGSCWEAEDEAGYSHLMEHLVFKSTERFPANQLTLRASYLGSNINAYTEFDSTCYYLTLSSRFGKEGLEILSEMARNANFSDLDFAYEKGVVLEELNQYENDPEDFFLEKIPNLYFEESPYKKPIIGSKKSLSEATADKLRSFYRKYYRPENCFLIVNGDFDKGEFIEEISHYFADWKTSDRKALRSNLDSFKPSKTLYPQKFTIDAMQKNIGKSLLGFTIPELSDTKPESHTLGLITRIFAVGKKSRLYRRLFVKEKLVDQIRVESFTGIYDGISIILIIPKDNSYVERIVDIFLEEYNKIRHFGFSIDEIDQARTELLHSHRYSFEYMQYLGMSLGTEELLGNYKLFIDYPKIIRRISEKSLLSTLKRFYSFEQLGIFHLGKSFDCKKRIRDKVRKLQIKKIANGATRGEFYESNLMSGTRVMMKRVIGRPTIGITAAFPVSQLNEKTGQRGINLLTSILLLYGNEKNSYDQLLEYCSRHGIQLDVSAQEEVTLVKIKCFSEMFATSLELLGDVIRFPLFPAEHFYNIQKTLLSNLDRAKDFPGYYAAHLWKRQIFGRDSNLLEKEGTKTTLRKISRKQVVNWFKEYYNLTDMSLSIVGDFDFEDTLFNCERIFNNGQTITEKQPQKMIINPGNLMRKNRLAHNQQAIIHVGGFGCSSKEIEKNTAFHLLAYVIGGDMSSRLCEELREKRGWAYSVGFDFISLKESGVFVASAMVDKRYSNATQKLITGILEDIKKRGVTESELEIAKNTIRGQRLRAEESVLGQSSAIAMLDVLGYGYDFYVNREKRLQKVRVNDLQDIANEYFRADSLYVHVLE